MGDSVNRTPDGRYIIVDGRRWRATDPNIPERLRTEIVAELMDARRSVKASRGELDLLTAARARVQNAKVALGERGEAWWEEPSTGGRSARIRAAILSLLSKRGPDSSICPSEAARIASSPDWRPAVAQARVEGAELARLGQIQVTQGETVITDPIAAQGPLRFRLLSEQTLDQE